MKRNRTNFKYNLNKLLKINKTSIKNITEHPVFGPNLGLDKNNTIKTKLLFNIHFIRPKELTLNEYNILKKEINGIIKKLNVLSDTNTYKINFPTPGVERAHTNKGILCRQGSGKGNITYYYYLFTPKTILMNFYINNHNIELFSMEKLEIFNLEIKQKLKAYPYLDITCFNLDS